jgi:hypothetical protein
MQPHRGAPVLDPVRPGVTPEPLASYQDALAWFEAEHRVRHALTMIREIGDRFGEADILTHLGDARHAAGDPAEAEDAWRQALAILDDLHHPSAGKVRAKLRPAAGARR